MLKLMDTIYVLKDGKLKNVNDYGGMQKYLYELEMQG